MQIKSLIPAFFILFLAHPALALMDLPQALDLIESEATNKSTLAKDDAKEALSVAIDAALEKNPPPALTQRIPLWQKQFPHATDRTKTGVISDLGKILTAYAFRQNAATPPDKIQADPEAAKFPGAVAKDAPRITKTLTIDPAGGGWKSTGLYAPPGELLTLTIPAEAAKQGWSVRIGCHTDKLWKLEKWPRFPDISRTFPLNSETTHAASAFGGLVYIVAPVMAGGQKISVTIANAVESPWFIEGQTDLKTWKEKIRNLPGAWAELQSDKIIISVPSAQVRTLDDPAALMAFWDKILDADADLAGLPHTRPHPQRITCDIEISAGYMHSGYPVMTHMDSAKKLVDLQMLSTTGDWGFFHELGHNHQQPDWTFPGTVEVTCNLFTVYDMDTVCSAPQTRKGFTEGAMLATMHTYVAAGNDFEKWKSDPFLALVMYMQLKDAFGWEPFKKVIAQYRTLTPAQRPKTELEKHDQWMIRMSQACGKNLGPFFQTWGVPVSDAALAQIKDLPQWMPQGWQGK